MMKKLIEESGLSIKEFSEKYGIPYNTVRQWYNGSRAAPDWLKKNFKNETAYIPLLHNKIYICYTIQHGIEVNPIIYKDITSVNEWIKHIKKCQMKGIIKEYEFIQEGIIK